MPAFIFVRSIWLVVTLVAFAAAAAAQSTTLDIYWIDVEGGAATLIVAPSGESLLVDAGWAVDDRDPKRIAAVARHAGLRQIDYFLLTHFHTDHAGGLTSLAKMIPIGRCLDHGERTEPENQKWVDAYLGVCGDKRTIVRAGDRVPMKGIDVDVVASAGRLVAQPINGGGPNPLCATAEHKPQDSPENQRSVGILVSYGPFTFLDLGDLNWAKEMELSCPVNRMGEVTIYQTSRHGAFDGAGAPAHLYAIRPQVVVINNGPRKGLGGSTPGLPQVAGGHFERIAKTPGIEGIWQGHLSLLDKAHNTAAEMIANVEETADCRGHWIRASVRPDGSFTVMNSRNGFSRTYAPRK